MGDIMRYLLLASAVCGSLLLAACGIRGPLYLPEVPAPEPSSLSDLTKPTAVSPR
jgi:predicted small lipoprotein YifL